MREYETVIITKPDQPESQFSQFGEKLKALIEKHQGRVFFSRSMGKRQLAYPIKKQLKGLYTCLDYAAGGNAVTDLERTLRLDENVLRFLTVLRQEEVDVEARAAEVMARGEDVSNVAQDDEAVRRDASESAPRNVDAKKEEEE